jgi:hypothetical protein
MRLHRVQIVLRCGTIRTRDTDPAQKPLAG